MLLVAVMILEIELHASDKSSLHCCSFGQGSSLLYTHMVRPFYNRPIVLIQEGRSLVDDVCECVHD